jgi:hypothetical protein
LYPEKIRAPWANKLSEAMKTKKTTQLVAPLPDADGKMVWWRTTFIPILNKDKSIKYVIGTSIDVTTEKNVEDRLKKSNVEELEQFNKMAVDRELKMVELKDRIKELESQLKARK